MSKVAVKKAKPTPAQKARAALVKPAVIDPKTVVPEAPAAPTATAAPNAPRPPLFTSPMHRDVEELKTRVGILEAAVVMNAKTTKAAIAELVHNIAPSAVLNSRRLIELSAKYPLA